MQFHAIRRPARLIAQPWSGATGNRTPRSAGGGQMKPMHHVRAHGAAGLFAVLLAGSAAAADWDAGAGKDWDALLAAAKKEGQVVVSVCPGGMVDTIRKMFKEDTGIDITF